MIENKQDWFLAIAENPDFTLTDFNNVGLNDTNVELKDRDFYKNNEYIQNKFQKDGKFDEESFNQMYDVAAQSYKIQSDKNQIDLLLGNTSYDPYNTLRPDNSKVEQYDVKLIRELNPDHLITGFGRIGGVAKATTSYRERAQKSKIFDWDKQQYLDYSPNDQALENSLGGFVKSLVNPLVVAKWEEDGQHVDPFTGRTLKHQKGDLKINDQGEYYYETLGKRSAYGKEIKSVFDSLTVDGSALNQYDFFDSDGLDKSVAGTVAKTVAVLTPLFTPLAGYYGWALVGSQLMDLLPSVYNATIGNFTDEPPKILSTIQGIGRSLRGSTSDYSKQNLVSTENLANTISDVALQWQQQLSISKGWNKLAGSDKITKQVQNEVVDKAKEIAEKKAVQEVLKTGDINPKQLQSLVKDKFQSSLPAVQEVLIKNKLKPLLEANNKTAANVALAYMASVQGIQSYEDALEAGTTKGEAALIAWGTILGMYGIGKTGLGEIFFPGLKDEARVSVRSAIDTLRNNIKEGYTKLAPIVDTRTKAMKLMQMGKDFASKYWDQVRTHSLGFIGKSFGEGLEELSEEGVADFFKATYNIASEFGLTSSDKPLFKFDDALQRYGMSLFGGAIGGAVFGGVEIVQNLKQPKANKEELVYLLRNGKKQDILDELQKYKQSGRLGSTSLSSQIRKNAEGANEFITAQDQSESQNEATYNLIYNYINQVDQAINQEQINLSDEDVLDKLIRSDVRLKQVQEVVGKDGINGRYLQDYNSLGVKILDIEAEIQKLIAETPDKVERNSKDQFSKQSQEYQTKLTKLQQAKQELIKQRDDFFSEENLFEYADKLLFEVNNNVNKPYYEANLQQYIEGRSRKTISELSEAQIDKFKQDYEIFKKASIRDKFNDAYEIYKNLNLSHTQAINDQGFSYEQFAKARRVTLERLIDPQKTLQKFGQAASLDEIPYLIQGKHNILEVLQDKYLALKTEEVSDEDYQKAVLDSLANISEIVDEFQAIGFVDSDTKNLLLGAIPEINVRGMAKSLEFDGSLSADQVNIIKNILAKLNGENLDSIIEELRTYGNEIDEDTVEFDLDTFEILEDSNLSKNLIQIAQNFHNAISNSEIFKTRQKVVQNLTNIKTNPLYGFLNQLSVSALGTQLGVIQLLEREDANFRKSVISDYNLNSVSEDEFAKAFHILDIAESLIDAADAQELSDYRIFGHNAIMNDFAKNNGINQEYGVIKSDIATMLRQDLYLIKLKLQFLQNISNINQANTYKAQEQTGINLQRLLRDVLKSKQSYTKLKEIKVNGIGLFDGVDLIQTPNVDAIDKELQGNDEIYIEIDTIINQVHTNFQAMLKTDSRKKVVDQVVEQLVGVFTPESLLKQDSSSLSPKTESFSNSDVITCILSICALDKGTFNSALYDVLSSSEVQFAPVHPQEYLVYIGTAMIQAPDLFRTYIEKVPQTEDQFGNDLVKLYNMMMVEGVGGAGKTSVVAKLIYQIASKLNNDVTVWNVAPTDSQIKGLNKQISPDKSFTIDNLLVQLLGEEAASELKQDIESYNTSSKYYDVVEKLFGAKESTKVPIIKSDIKINSKDLPKIIFIDEVTHLNTIYAQIISKVAQQSGTIIIGLGDLDQSGYENVNKAYTLYNVGKGTACMIRTPKLDISMRNANIQKKANNDTLKLILDYAKNVPFNEVQGNPAEYVKNVQSMIQDSSLQWLSNSEEPINGDRVLESITDKDLDELVRKTKERAQKDEKSDASLIYVYDDIDSPTYKVVDQYIKTHPEANIEKYEAKGVQGRESYYTIIDVDFSQDSLEDPRAVNIFLEKFNTLLTRAQEGSTFIDRGLTQAIPQLQFSQSVQMARTPDLSSVLKTFIENRLKVLEKTKELKLAPVKEKTPTVTKEPKDVAELQKNIQDLLNDLNTSLLSDEQKESFKTSIQELNQKIQQTPSEEQLKQLVQDFQKLQQQIHEASENYSKFLDQWNILSVRKTDVLNQYSSLNQENEELSEVVDSINNFTPKNFEDLQDLQELIERLEKELAKITPASVEIISNDNDKKLLKILDKEAEDQDISLPDNIRIYGFYNRLGGKIEDDIFKAIDTTSDLGFLLDFYNGQTQVELNSDDFIAYRTILDLIQSQISYGLKDWSGTKDELKTLGVKESIIENIDKGEFKIIASKFDENSDVPYNMLDYNPNKQGENLFRLVYQVKVGDQTWNITIGELANPLTWIESERAKGVKDKDLKKEITDYEKWYRLTSNKLADGPIVFDVPKDNLAYSGFTDLHKINTHIDLDEFKRLHPNAVISNPYIYSGHGEDSVGFHKSKKLRGCGVKFITHAKYIEVDGKLTKVTPDNIADLYYKLNQDSDNSTPIIRAVVIDPKGMFSEDYFRVNLATETEAKEFFETVGSINTAQRFFLSMWNHRAKLHWMLDQYKKDEGDATKCNLALDRRPNKFPFRIATKIAFMSGVESRNDSNIVYISPKYAELQIQLLDNLINACLDLSGMSSFRGVKADQLITDSNNNIHDTLKQLEKPCTLQLVNSNQTRTSVESSTLFTSSMAFGVTNILTAYYRLATTGDFQDGIIEVSVKTPSGKVVSAIDILNITPNTLKSDLESLKSDLDSIGKSRTGFIKDLYNIVFHGNPQPDGKTFISFTAFPYGVFYHPRYAKSNKSANNLFYPMKNDENQFRVNVVVNRPYITINSLSRVKEVTFEEVKEPAEVVELEETSKLSLINDKFKETFTDEEEAIQKIWEDLDSGDFINPDNWDAIFIPGSDTSLQEYFKTKGIEEIDSVDLQDNLLIINTKTHKYTFTKLDRVFKLDKEEELAKTEKPGSEYLNPLLQDLQILLGEVSIEKFKGNTIADKLVAILDTYPNDEDIQKKIEEIYNELPNDIECS